jgi:DNA ligase-1
MFKISIFLILLTLSLFSEKPNLLLLKSYKKDSNVTGWLISEKLDGVRAYWNGKKLISRSGKEFAVPQWFIEDFPPFEIDGELWTKRNDFEHILSIVNRQMPHKGWRALTYNVFEVPNQNGKVLKRLDVLKAWLKNNPNRYIHIIPQKICKGSEHLQEILISVGKKKAEGLVVRDPNSLYINKRTSKALKVKSFTDDECIVTGYTNGRGKFEGLVGALVCKWQDRFLKIGSGLSLEERKKPPMIGSEITFKYNGLTKYGNPKYPVFLRIRNFK